MNTNAGDVAALTRPLISEQELLFRERIAKLLADLHEHGVLSEQQCAKLFGTDLLTWRILEDGVTADEVPDQAGGEGSSAGRSPVRAAVLAAMPIKPAHLAVFSTPEVLSAERIEGLFDKHQGASGQFPRVEIGRAIERAALAGQAEAVEALLNEREALRQICGRAGELLQMRGCNDADVLGLLSLTRQGAQLVHPRDPAVVSASTLREMRSSLHQMAGLAEQFLRLGDYDRAASYARRAYSLKAYLAHVPSAGAEYDAEPATAPSASTPQDALTATATALAELVEQLLRKDGSEPSAQELGKALDLLRSAVSRFLDAKVDPAELLLRELLDSSYVTFSHGIFTSSKPHVFSLHIWAAKARQCIDGSPDRPDEHEEGIWWKDELARGRAAKEMLATQVPGRAGPLLQPLQDQQAPSQEEDVLGQALVAQNFDAIADAWASGDDTYRTQLLHRLLTVNVTLSAHQVREDVRVFDRVAKAAGLDAVWVIVVDQAGMRDLEPAVAAPSFSGGYKRRYFYVD